MYFSRPRPGLRKKKKSVQLRGHLWICGIWQEREGPAAAQGRVRERASVLAAQGVEGGMEGADDVECIENCSVVDGTGADIGVRGGEQGSLRTRWARRRGMCERDE